MNRIAKPAALFFAAVFAILATAGFFENPVIGPTALVEANRNLSFVYLGFVALLVTFGLGGESRAATGLYYTSVLCLLLALIGFWQADNLGRAELFDVIHVNRTTCIFHGAWALVLAAAGKMNTARHQVIRD